MIQCARRTKTWPVPLDKISAWAVGAVSASARTHPAPERHLVGCYQGSRKGNRGGGGDRDRGRGRDGKRERQEGVRQGPWANTGERRGGASAKEREDGDAGCGQRQGNVEYTISAAKRRRQGRRQEMYKPRHGDMQRKSHKRENKQTRHTESDGDADADGRVLENKEIQPVTIEENRTLLCGANRTLHSLHDSGSACIAAGRTPIDRSCYC